MTPGKIEALISNDLLLMRQPQHGQPDHGQLRIMEVKSAALPSGIATAGQFTT